MNRPTRHALHVVAAGLIGLAAGASLAPAWRLPAALAADHQAAPASAKAPLQEVIHCPLAFAGVHLLKDLPEWSQVAYHYCKPVNDELSQCVIYDGTGPDARLLGTEYLVSEAVYQRMPAEEKVYWHDHKYEVDAGYLKSLTQTGDEEKQTLAKVRTLWGKTYHTWASGSDYPRGPARLYWAVTGERPYVLPQGARLPAELSTGNKTDGK